MEALMQDFAIENLELLEQSSILNNQHNPKILFFCLANGNLYGRSVYLKMFTLG
jgi:hypothetical protein